MSVKALKLLLHNDFCTMSPEAKLILYTSKEMRKKKNHTNKEFRKNANGYIMEHRGRSVRIMMQ